MAYELLQSGNTSFAVDWSVIERLVRSYYTAYRQLQIAREVTLSDSHWYNPMSWSLPDVTNIEVDWHAVRRYADADTVEDLRRMRRDANSNAAGVAYQLESMIETAARNKEAYIDWMGDVQTKNMQSINQAVDAYESKIEIAKLTRDMSADGLMVGASVMSGGAALTVMGAGSMLKGEAKFQDTGHLGAAVMEGAGSFVFAYVKLSKTFSLKEDMVLALVQATYKTGTELVDGATLGKAALTGGLELTGPATDRLFKPFERIAVPLVISYRGKNVASTVLTKFAQTEIEGAGKRSILNLGSAAKTDVPASSSPRRKGDVIAQTTLTSKYLLYLAFVNMNKGIGRGW